MADLRVKKVLMVSEEQSEWLDKASRVNTSGNESELMRRLINLAMHDEERFGLLPTFQNALVLELA
jgi:hypothetical protein